MRKFTLSHLAVIALLGVGGCARTTDAAPSKAQAISIARAEWGADFIGDRKLRAERREGQWIVTRERRAGDPSEDSVFIDARSGRLRRSSVNSGDLVLDPR